ncbi:hypothetical protein ACO0LC_15905 [Undibacterium sp. JH2W]|uniref:hypothetical protein n=1 Tax=Undibacterium sp. JH2W TaxID=3413037 RepID=UPI003BF43EDC
MNSLQSTELVSLVVQEIAFTAPEGWQKIVYYQEILTGSDGHQRNMATARCWCGSEMRENHSLQIGGSHEVFESIMALHEHLSKRSQSWQGLLLVVSGDGKFSSQFFYNSTPLLDGNDSELRKILDSVS